MEELAGKDEEVNSLDMNSFLLSGSEKSKTLAIRENEGTNHNAHKRITNYTQPRRGPGGYFLKLTSTSGGTFKVISYLRTHDEHNCCVVLLVLNTEKGLMHFGI